jgi:DNA modification methylase
MQQATYAKLPQAPITASPVPHLTSLYHFDRAGEYGDRSYPGNCGGNIIKDLLKFYGASRVFDPMTGSGTCRDVCKEQGIYCFSSDLHEDRDACDASQFPRECFDFAWIHPPYWRQKLYTEDPRCLSRTATLKEFLDRYRLLIENCKGALVPGGKLAILMGDYNDREEGFVPLVFWTKYLAFKTGMKQCATDIVRFSHGASSGKKVYKSSFIPGLHDVCAIFEKGE